ncbi:prolyl oligopeptidase family serine peptidase [Candidatus Bathyarchaeota archaeon]|nr:prolyl oligopeptidase family serine peptidase [Candidatus Bathyarchaeota archaeon]
MRPVINDAFNVESEILDETREIFVYLPPNHQESSLTYPVIYLLDGHNLHNVCASFVQHYSDRDRMPHAIVVGIASTDRLRDFTPTEREAYNGEYGGGGAENFLKFMSDELFPIVEEKYPTGDYRVLIGHSYGGLLVSHALASRQRLFRAYLACSPWFSEADNRLIQNIERQLQAEYEKTKHFYLAHEPISSPGIEDRIVRMKEVFEEYSDADFVWEYKRYEDADHSNLPLKAIPDALDFFFPGFIQD